MQAFFSVSRRNTTRNIHSYPMIRANLCELKFIIIDEISIVEIHNRLCEIFGPYENEKKSNSKKAKTLMKINARVMVPGS